MHLRCEKQRSSWIKLRRSRKAIPAGTGLNNGEASLPQEQVSRDFTESLSNLPAMDVPSIIFPCIHDALKWLSCGREAMLQGDLLQPPAFPPPRKLEEASQVQVCCIICLFLATCPLVYFCSNLFIFLVATFYFSFSYYIIFYSPFCRFW